MERIPTTDPKHAEILGKGREVWNRWRRENPELKPSLRRFGTTDLMFGEPDLNLSEWDLRGVDLRHAFLIRPDLRNADLREAVLSYTRLVKADLRGAILDGADLMEASIGYSDLSGLDLSKQNLNGAKLKGTDFTKANLSGAGLRSANLSNANVSEADLTNADLTKADLTKANFTRATLSGANLEGTILVSTNFQNANLTNCKIYGISAWDINLTETTQSNLVITRDDEPTVTVDNLEVAQFIYLLFNNQKVRDVIDTITSKVVLILGRFSEERKAILDAIREELRCRNFTPVLFDFDKPASKDTTGTVETLARIARFIIADLTEPRSIPHELAIVVPSLRTTPVVPIKLADAGDYSMFKDFERSYTRVLKTHVYTDGLSLIASLPEIIEPADKMAAEFRKG
ncbi:MAG: pentapeptide repeat-containing protein [Planctomycetota bacterium]|jgi:uncharacterized protein YjbI with pentapeptide repeats